MSCGYHFTASPVSFGKGQSAVHKAAYNARCALSDERNGRQTRDYLYLGEPIFSGIFAPPNAPSWVKDREQLWNKAEAAERQKINGQPARNIEFAFPHQMEEKQREWLLKDFVREQFVRAGMIADVSIHNPHPDGDQRNVHAHVLLTMRELEGENFARTKNRDWNTKEQLGQWRERWAEKGARALERAGHKLEAERWRNGHLTLPEQRKAALARGDVEFAAGLDRQPTTHRGPYVDAVTRKGKNTERVAAFEETNRDNAELVKLKAELAEVQAQIAAERELFINLNEAAMLGPAEVLGEAVKAKVGKAVDAVAEAAQRARAKLFDRRPADTTQVDGKKIDWRRYIDDQAYRKQVDAQKEPQPERGRSTELER